MKKNGYEDGSQSNLIKFIHVDEDAADTISESLHTVRSSPSPPSKSAQNAPTMGLESGTPTFVVASDSLESTTSALSGTASVKRSANTPTRPRRSPNTTRVMPCDLKMPESSTKSSRKPKKKRHQSRLSQIKESGGTWSDFRDKTRRELEELRMVTLSTNALSKASTQCSSSSGLPSKTASKSSKKTCEDFTSPKSDLNLSARAFTPSSSSIERRTQQRQLAQQAGYKVPEGCEARALNAYNIVEYLVTNIKRHERVAGIKISVERKFPPVEG